MKNKKTVVLTENQKQELNGYAEKVNLLQTQIVANDAIIIQHSKKSVELAIKAGDLLRKAKELAGHGNWKKCMKEKFPSISERTIQNYMNLSKNFEENSSILNDVTGLREAYKRIGICNDTPKVEEAGASPENEANEDTVSPAKMKETDKAQYDTKRSEARQNAITHVRQTISEATKVSWKLSSWKLVNDKPCSDEEANHGAALFDSLKEWAAKREYKDLRHDDEISTKTGVILNEIVKSFILANTTTGTSTPFAQVAPDFVMELNPALPESVEPMAA